MYDFDLPYIGAAKLCWDCRREIAIRTVERPTMVGIDGGRLGYDCKQCGGQFTSTDAMTCKCPGRAEDCAEESRVQKQWSEWATLTLWKPRRTQAIA